MLLIWLLLGAIAAGVAGRKGRSVPGWFVLGLLFGPFALLAIAAASPDTSRTERADLQSRRARHCPECRGVIPSDARRCRHCGATDLPPPQWDFWGREMR